MNNDILNQNLVNDTDITTEPVELNAQSVLQILRKFDDKLGYVAGTKCKDALIYKGIRFMREPVEKPYITNQILSIPLSSFNRPPVIGERFFMFAKLPITNNSYSNSTTFLYYLEVTTFENNAYQCTIKTRSSLTGNLLIYNDIISFTETPTTINVTLSNFNRYPLSNDTCLIPISINNINYFALCSTPIYGQTVNLSDNFQVQVIQLVQITNTNILYLHNVSIRTSADDSIIIILQYLTKTNIAFTNLTDFINDVYSVYGQNNLSFSCIGRYIYNNKTYNITGINILSNSLKFRFTMPDVRDQSTYYQLVQLTSDVNVIDKVINI